MPKKQNNAEEQNNAIAYVAKLIQKGYKVGIFSCEDPLNTPFHKDILSLRGYTHLRTEAGALVSPATLELGITRKGITAFGIFAHYGNIHGHDVCGAVNAIIKGYENEQLNFKRHLDMSEIATHNILASARSKRAISEHELRNSQSEFLVCQKSTRIFDTQKHAPCFSTGSVFDKIERVFKFDKAKPVEDNLKMFLKSQFAYMAAEISRIKQSAGIAAEIRVFGGIVYNLSPEEYTAKIIHGAAV